MPALPPDGLAVASWRTPKGIALDLRYAPDEAAWLEPRPARVWEGTLTRLAALGADAAGFYAVDDPYGGERGAPAVARCFGCILSDEQVTFAAGVTAHLHALAALAAGDTLLTAAYAHPDLAVWARAFGADVVVVPPPLSADGLTAAIQRVRPALVGLDRPAFGGELLDAEGLEKVAAEAERHGAPVVVDEAPASYLPPEASAIGLLDRAPNLIVLRGFTKAYSLAGMRVGYAVAGRGVARRVRTVATPLQVSEVSLQVALALLEAGDVCARLRERIHAVKPGAAGWLKEAGFAVRRGHADVPAVVVDDGDGAASRRMGRLGIRGLASSPGPPALVHLRLPIGEERLERLREVTSSRRAPVGA